MFLKCVISLFLMDFWFLHTQAFTEKNHDGGHIIANVVPMLALVCEKQLHWQSAHKVLYIYIYIYVYIYIYIYICMCLPILCSYVLLMLLCMCSHALMTHPLWWAQVSALAALKPMALAFLQVCCNGLVPNKFLVDALRHGVEAGLLNIGFVLEA